LQNPETNRLFVALALWMLFARDGKPPSSCFLSLLFLNDSSKIDLNLGKHPLRKALLVSLDASPRKTQNQIKILPWKTLPKKLWGGRIL